MFDFEFESSDQMIIFSPSYDFDFPVASAVDSDSAALGDSIC